MTTEAATDLVLRADQKFFDQKQVAALRAMGVNPDTNNADLAVFFHQARRTGLDPFAKQIYLMQRRAKDQSSGQWVTKSTIQTGIDGYRLIARKAAARQGTDYDYGPVEWCDSEGNWTDVWLHPGEAPIAARVTLYVGEKNKQFPAIAHYSEYVQVTKDGAPNSMWQKMAASQLAKCAEALALRKAFPLDLSGIYTDDEMQQADIEDLGEQRMSGDPEPAAADAPTTKVGRARRKPAASAKPAPSAPEPESHAPAAAAEETNEQGAVDLLEDAPTNADSDGVVPDDNPAAPDPEDPAQPPADYASEPAPLEDMGEQDNPAQDPTPRPEPAPKATFKPCTPGQFRKIVELAGEAYADPTERKAEMVAWFADERNEDITEIPGPEAISRDEAEKLAKYLQDVISGIIPVPAGE
jgi:phage recombination protein Bet